jgi:hypothetical protein
MIVRLRHVGRWFFQHFRRPNVLLIGEYHGANLGDYLLGHSLYRFFKEKGLVSVQQTLHNIKQWPKFRNCPIIIGGGNLLHKDTLKEIAMLIDLQKSHVDGLGLDYNDANELLNFWPVVNRFRHLTFRSYDQLEKFEQKVPQSKDVIIGHHPDLVWSLADYFNSVVNRREYNRSSKAIAINVLPLYSRVVDGRIVSSISKEDPFFKQAAAESESYFGLVLEVVKYYLAHGYEVIHIPFAVEDDDLAQLWLQPMGVKCEPYTLNLKRILKLIRSCKYFIPTRFHALVVGLMLDVPLRPIPYAKKCSDLLNDCGRQDWATHTPNNFCAAPHLFSEFLVSAEPVTVSADFRNMNRDEVYAWLEKLSLPMGENFDRK